MKGILRPRQWYSRVAHLWDSLLAWSERWRRAVRKPLFPRLQPAFEQLERRQLLATVSVGANIIKLGRRYAHLPNLQ